MKTAKRKLILRLFATLVVVGGMLMGCNNLTHPEATADGGQNPPLDSGNTIDALESGTTSAPQNDGEEGGFTVTLGEGSAQPAEAEPLTVVEGQPLSAEAAAALFARLPELPLEAGAQQEFRLPDESLPPRPGETVAEVFPPEAENAPPEVPGGPLEVLRYAPQGEVEIAPFHQRHLQPADGAAHRPGHIECLRGTGVHRTGVARNLALAGHAHAQLSVCFRATRPPADGDRIHRHHPGWDDLANRWRASRRCAVPFQYPPRLDCRNSIPTKRLLSRCNR